MLFTTEAEELTAVLCLEPPNNVEHPGNTLRNLQRRSGATHIYSSDERS